MSETYNLNTAWFRGLPTTATPEDRQRRADLVLSSHAILDALAEIISVEIEAGEKTSLTDYDNPNWALKEADRHGQRRFARKMLEIIKRTPNAG